MPYWGPAGRVSGGLEAARSKGVLGFDGIKMHRMAGGLVLLIYPMRCNVPCNSSRRGVYGIVYIQAVSILLDTVSVQWNNCVHFC